MGEGGEGGRVTIPDCGRVCGCCITGHYCRSLWQVLYQKGLALIALRICHPMQAWGNWEHIGCRGEALSWDKYAVPGEGVVTNVHITDQFLEGRVPLEVGRMHNSPTSALVNAKLPQHVLELILRMPASDTARTCSSSAAPTAPTTTTTTALVTHR